MFLFWSPNSFKISRRPLLQITWSTLLTLLRIALWRASGDWQVIYCERELCVLRRQCRREAGSGLLAHTCPFPVFRYQELGRLGQNPSPSCRALCLGKLPRVFFFFSMSPVMIWDVKGLWPKKDKDESLNKSSWGLECLCPLGHHSDGNLEIWEP